MTVIYGSNVANTTLTTSCKMAANTGGTETSVTTTVTGLNQYVEVVSQAATLSSVTAIGSPSGKGWTYSPGAGTFAAGNWSAAATFSSSPTGVTDVTMRFYKYTSGTYSSIGSINVTGVNNNKNTYTFAATSMPATTFTATDLLYIDIWWHDTTGANDDPIIYVSNSSTAGVANDLQVTTSTFTASSGGVTISRVQGNSVNSTGSVTSQAVTLPTGITQGNLVVASVATGSNNTTFTGPTGWTQATINQPAGASATIETSIWWLVVGSGQAGQTSWTWTLSASHSAYICIEEWNATNGWQASPVDKTGNGDTIATPVTATTIVSGTTATTTQAIELWVASLAYKNSAQTESSITTGWTKDLESTLALNNTMTMLYQIASSTGTAACQYTIGTAQFWAGCVVTFKPNVATTNTRTISTAAALQTTNTRTITTTSALQTTNTRTIPTASVLATGSSTALTLAFANEASTTLTTANKLYGVVNGSPSLASPTTNQTYTVFGTQTGFVEIAAQGNFSATANVSIPAPSGNGFLYDTTSLEGQQILAGNYSSIIRLNASQWDGTTGLTQGGTLIADLYLRGWIRSSAGSYTNLFTTSLSAQTFSGTFTNYSPATTGTAASPSFNTGDKLYFDIIANVTTNANANIAQGFRLNRLTTDTTTNIGDTFGFIITPGYQLAGGSTTITDTLLTSFVADATTLQNNNTTITDTQLSTFFAEATQSASIPINTTGIIEQLTSFVAEASAAGSIAITEQLTSFVATPSLQGVQTQTEQLTSFDASSQQAGFRTISEQITQASADATTIKNINITITDTNLASFYAEATSSASTGELPPGVMVSIAGTPVSVLYSGFEIDDSISSVSTASMTIKDDTGLKHFTKSQQVTIADHDLGVLYTGFVNSAEEDKQIPNDLLFSKIDSNDNHYLTGKRSYPGPEFTNTFAGPIVTEVLNTLTAEGITAPYESRRETTAAQLSSGTLSNTVGANNVADGDLELAPSGTSVSIVENTTSIFSAGTLTNVAAANNSLTATSSKAIKLTGTMNVPDSTNAQVFYKIWSGTYTIQANDRVSFYCWIDSTSPEIKATLDVVCTDGTRLQDKNGDLGYSDFNGIEPGANNDLAGYADGQWYFRRFNLSGFAGKSITYIAVGLGGQKTGTYAAYFRNILVRTGDTGTIHLTAFNTTLATTAQQLQTTGYKDVNLSVVPVYDLQRYVTVGAPLNEASVNTFPQTNIHRRVSTAYSVAAASILKNTIISWNAIEPENTKVAIRCSLDNGTAMECTNNGAIPNLVPGMNLTGRSLTILQDFYYLDGIANPEITPTLQDVGITLTSAPFCTKTDAAYTTAFSGSETGASFSATIANSSVLNLTGATRNWDLNLGLAVYDTDQTRFLGTAGDGIIKRAYEFGNPSANNESKTRFDFAGQHQNFIAEIDVQILSDIQIGMVYRSTNFSSNNGSYAYVAAISATDVILSRGTNTTAGGTATLLSDVPLSFSDQSWHRLKVDVNGSTHKVYVDDVLCITAIDATFGSAGFIGATGGSPSTAFPQFNFDNFGVMDKLFGTWISPNISLNSVGTYGNSYLSWRDRSASPDSNNIVTVDTSIDNGVTWQSVSNGTEITSFTAGQSLTGVNLKIRVNLFTTTAQSMPGLDNLYVLVTGAYNAVGTRISPTMSLTNVGRLGGSLVEWNALTPTGTTLGVDIAVDGGSWVDVTSSNGGVIPGLNAQQDPLYDTFDGSSSYVYTNTSRTGGTLASWTQDTANSRIVAEGGAGAFYHAVFDNDIDMYTDMDQSDAGGLMWRAADPSNFYALTVCDASSTIGTPNTAVLTKYFSGGPSAIITTTTINFPRGSLKRFRVTMLGAVVTIYVDGLQLMQFTDGVPIASGRCGLWNDGGTAQFYQLWILRLGDDVTARTLQSRFRLASTDPTMTPQITDHILAAYGSTIAKGSLIPQTDYTRKYISDCLDDLAKQSNYWWYIDRFKVAHFLPRTGMPAPWIGTSVLRSDGTADFLAGVKILDQSDMYRNRQIITNVIDTVAVSESRLGDGVSTSWTFGNAWASAPAITINGVAATVGVKNVDTGRDFYYAVGDSSIVADTSSPVYNQTQLLKFAGIGQFVTESIYDNTDSQSILAIREGSSGIVEDVEDGGGITKAAGDALAQARIAQYGVLGQTLTATTLRTGLAPGQLLTVFLPEYDIHDEIFLIRSVKTYLTDKGDGTQLFWYDIEAISGPDIGDWSRIYVKN